VEKVEAKFRCLIKEELELNLLSQFVKNKKYPLVYIHCLKGSVNSSNSNNYYPNKNGFPFKTTTDYLGIMFNRSFEKTNPIRFWMFQEKK
jgi:hypothetical protein